MAEGFVTMKRVEAQSLEHRYLKDEVNPGKTDEHREEEHSDSSVEGQYVAERHQWQTLLTELLSNGIINREFLYQRTQQLELRRLSFLSAYVANIEEEVELLEPLFLVPPETLKASLQLDACIQLTPLFTQRHPKVDIAIIIGYSALTRVAIEACPKDDEEYPDAPDGIEPDGYADVDADEPKLATKAIEHSTDERRLSRHASKLPVGTIVPVSPNEHQHTDEVVAKVVESKEIGRRAANDDAQQRDDYRMNVQPTKEERPQIAWGASDIEFEVALYVSRLHCCKYSLLERHQNIICPKNSGRWKSGFSVLMGFQLMK